MRSTAKMTGRVGGASLTDSEHAEMVVSILMQPDSGEIDLLDVLAHRPSWQSHAACRGMSPSQFFPRTSDEITAAKEVCGRCPVREQCLEMVIDDRRASGVWGGTTETERSRMARSVAAARAPEAVAS